jgi:hypothetical protein
MMNEMNTMLLRLLNGGGGSVDAGAGAGGADINTVSAEDAVVDRDGLFPSCEMTEIILSDANLHNQHEVCDAPADADVEMDAEAEADAAEADVAEVDAAEADAAEADAAEADADESDEIRALEPTDYTYDEYERHHFIEPISLVVSEL